MSAAFSAYRIHRDASGGIEARYERLRLDDLSDGDVVIRAAYSSINYKDALAATGAGKILRRFPLVGGIDVAGQVERSADPRYAPGQPVLVTGCGLGESRDGGYAGYVRADGDTIVPIPAGLDARSAMAIGTAGFTAALAIDAMEHNGLAPERGEVVVTGASGGVGSLAVDILAGRGYSVVAVSGKAECADYLRELGAAEILDRRSIDYGNRPLEKSRWVGAIDSVGGDMLAWLTRTTGYRGTIASIGLAGSHELHTTVMPFILRGIVLIGINCDQVSRDERLAIWRRLAGDLRPAHLADIARREVAFEDLPVEFERLLRGESSGRTVVRIAR